MSVIMFDRKITQKKLSIIIFCLYSAWLLSFLFEGQVLYSIIESAQIEGAALVKSAVLAIFIGLFSSGLLIKKQATAKTIMIIAIIVCISGSLTFYFPFSMLWYITIAATAYFAGLFLASWGFYFKANFNSEERFKRVAELLIYSNVLMIIINVLTVSTSATVGLTVAVISLVGTLPFLFRLESYSNLKIFNKINTVELPQRMLVASRPFIFLCIFILIITVNSGLMYQVVNPAFVDYKILTAIFFIAQILLRQ